MKYTKEMLEKVEFNDLMYAYRIADPLDQDRVVEKYDEVKNFISGIINQNEKMHEAIDLYINGEQSVTMGYYSDDQTNAIGKMESILKELKS